MFFQPGNLTEPKNQDIFAMKMKYGKIFKVKRLWMESVRKIKHVHSVSNPVFKTINNETKMRYRFFIIFVVSICKVLIGADFSVDPLIFSPNESPGEKDTTRIEGNMEQTLPVNVNIYNQNQQGVLQRTIPYSQFNYNYGNSSVQ